MLGRRLRTHGGEERILGAGGRYRTYQAHARRPVLRRVPPDPGSGQEAWRHDRGQALLFAHVQPLPVLQGLHRQVLQRRQGRDHQQHEGVCQGVRVHVQPKLLRRGHPLRPRRRAPERADIRPQELYAHPICALRSQERGVFGRGIRGLRPARELHRPPNAGSGDHEELQQAVHLADPERGEGREGAEESSRSQ